MQSLSIWILILTSFSVLLVAGYNMYVMDIAKDKIFDGSGKPEAMAQVVFRSIQATYQMLLAITAVGITFAMMVEKALPSEAGLPVISGVIGYIMGKSPKISKGTKSD